MLSFALFPLLLLCGGGRAVDWDVETPLDEYVNRAEDVFSWEELQSTSQDGYDLHVLNLTSLRWLDDALTQHPVWWHFLYVAVPHELRVFDMALLRIGGGYRNDSILDPEAVWPARIGRLCRQSGAVTAMVTGVPNQPVFYGNSSISRIEDMVIAASWRLYLTEERTEPEVNVIFPMVKAAKLAFDATAQFVRSVDPTVRLTKYVPSGNSKRGWVTWLLGATDPRVIAVAPNVFDYVDQLETLHHHRRCLGGWSFAFGPYYLEGITGYLLTDIFAELIDMTDPITFNERLTMPKLITLTTGDEFMIPDNARYWWSNLTQGPNFLHYLENANHMMRPQMDRAYDNIEAFFTSVITGFALPTLSWTTEKDESGFTVRMSTDRMPEAVNSWSADTTNRTGQRRDFRLRTLLLNNAINWTQDAVTSPEEGVYERALEYRDDFGWRGLFLTAEFAGPGSRKLEFSTEISIQPEVLPFPRCNTTASCRGILV